MTNDEHKVRIAAAVKALNTAIEEAVKDNLEADLRIGMEARTNYPEFPQVICRLYWQIL